VGPPALSRPLSKRVAAALREHTLSIRAGEILVAVVRLARTGAGLGRSNPPSALQIAIAAWFCARAVGRIHLGVSSGEVASSGSFLPSRTGVPFCSQGRLFSDEKLLVHELVPSPCRESRLIRPAIMRRSPY
jgi:hypothetical protein